MKKALLITLLGVTATAATNSFAAIDPEQDRKELVNFFMKKNPNIKFEDYRLGAYNYSKDKMAQYKDAMEFPPYLDAIDAGEALYEKDKAVYDKCFGSDVTKVRVKYPYYDKAKQRVETLESAINECRTNAGLKPFKWKKGPIAQLSAFYADKARGQKIHVVINSEGARKAYEAGRKMYITPMGQLNLSCAKCHTYNAGHRARANILSPNLGHTTGFPVFRAKWQALGTLHRRFTGCQKNMRLKPFKAQSNEYRNLEFFEAYISNGLEIDGPSYRE